MNHLPLKPAAILSAGVLFLLSCTEEKSPDVSSSPPPSEVTRLRSTVASLEWELIRERQLRRSEQKDHQQALAEFNDHLTELRARPQATPLIISRPLPASPPPSEKSIRLAAIGEEHATLTTLAGDHYANLTIIRATDIGITIRHSGGIARISYSELPPTWQERFSFDPKQAAIAEKTEQARQRKYFRAVAKSQYHESMKKLRDLESELSRTREMLESERARDIAVVHEVNDVPLPAPVDNGLLEAQACPAPVVEAVFVEVPESCPLPRPHQVIKPCPVVRHPFQPVSRSTPRPQPPVVRPNIKPSITRP